MTDILDTNTAFLKRRALRPDGSRKITWEELEKHDNDKSCWISIEGGVYDVTEWINNHPGKIVLQTIDHFNSLSTSRRKGSYRERGRARGHRHGYPVPH